MAEKSKAASKFETAKSCHLGALFDKPDMTTTVYDKLANHEKDRGFAEVTSHDGTPATKRRERSTGICWRRIEMDETHQLTSKDRLDEIKAKKHEKVMAIDEGRVAEEMWSQDIKMGENGLGSTIQQKCAPRSVQSRAGHAAFD